MTYRTSSRILPQVGLAIGPLPDSHQHDIAAMLRELLGAESRALDLFRQLLRPVEGELIGLEEQ